MSIYNILSPSILLETWTAQDWTGLCCWQHPPITYEAFLTGVTEVYNNACLKDRVFSDYITRLYNESFSANTDTFVSGGTLNPGTGVVTFRNTTGGTIDVSGFDGFDSYWSASTGGISNSGLTGNVGIGTTSPLGKLDVREANVSVQTSNSMSDGVRGLKIIGTNAAIELDGSGNSWWVSALSSGLSVYDTTANAYRLKILNNGNVGIGTTAPAQKLEIDGFILLQNNDEIRFKDTGGTERTAIELDGSNDLNIGTSAGGNLKFINGSSYTERMRITSAGNVGIGTNTPTEKLTVEGSISGSTNLYIGGNTNISGTTSYIGAISGTGSVTAIGGFVGNVTGNVSGSAGIAAVGAVTNDAEEKMVFLNGSNMFRVVSSGFSFNPSTKLLTATGFIGNLTGNSDTATKITSITNADIVQLDDTQTLTNKTLTTPVITSISNSGTVTIPTGADTLVARTSTDTLTNKTLTAPVIAMGTNKITGLGNPTAAQDAVTKAYVDGLDHIDYWSANTDGSISTSGVTNVKISGNTQIAGTLNVGGTITGNLTGEVTGNSSTSTKIASIDNVNIVQLAGAQTLTGTKTLNSFKGTGSVTVTDIKDTDNFSDATATSLATSESIKAYVDSQDHTDYWSANTDGSITNSGNTNITTTGDLIITGAGVLSVDGVTNLDNTDIDGTFTMDGTAFDVNGTTTVAIDNTNTTNGVTINTVTSGGKVFIGHTTSETTVNDNLTVTGTLTMGSTAAITSAGLLSVANQSNITGVGTITSGTWNAGIIAEGKLQNQSGTNTGDETLSRINALDVTEVGTITSGVWNGTDVGVEHGGTGVSTLTDGGILLGSGTGAITAMAVLTDGQMIVGDGTTDPVAESGATLRTSIGVDEAGTDNSTDVTLNANITDVLTLSTQAISATDPGNADILAGWDHSSNKFTYLSAADVITAVGLGTGAVLDTGTISDGGAGLATADQIHTFVTDFGYTTATGDVTLAGTQTITGVKTIGTNVKLQFRDANTFIHSNAANDLLISGTDVEIAATNIILDAGTKIDLQQNTDVTGDLTVSGKLVMGSTDALTNAGLLSVAAQTNITSLGTLTGLDVDNININGDTITASADLTIVATGNDITVDTDNFVISSSTGQKPGLEIINTTDGNKPPEFIFSKLRANGVGVDGDYLGTVEFNGKNDNNDGHTFGMIMSRISDASDGTEEGILQIGVAAHNGVAIGFVLEANGNGVADSTIGVGAASVVTIPGHIDLAGNIDVDGTSNLDVVDIDGAVDMASTLQVDGALTVSVSDTGADVIFHSATANEGVHYDASEDELGLLLTTKLKFHDIGGGEEIFASANGHLEINAGTTLDVTAPTVQINSSTKLDLNAAVLDMDLTNTSTITLTSGGAAKDLTIEQVGANDSSIIIQAAGTGADAIKLNATAGSIDIDSGDNITVNAADDITIAAAGGDITISTPDTYGTKINAREFTQPGTSANDRKECDITYAGGQGTIALGDLVYMHTDGRWNRTDANAVETATGLLGIALGSNVSESGVVLRGMYTLDHNLGDDQKGRPLYLSGTVAQATFTAPSADGDVVRIIGYQLGNADEIWFNPDNTWVELG